MTILGNVRALRALNMHRNGSRLPAIAETFNVTKQRALQLVARGAEVERRMTSTDPWDELSARCRNALTRNGCEPTPDGVVDHLKTCDWRRIPAFGRKCFAELNDWLARHGKAIE